jgi:hypothetical protein
MRGIPPPIPIPRWARVAIISVVVVSAAPIVSVSTAPREFHALRFLLDGGVFVNGDGDGLEAEGNEGRGIHIALFSR